MKKCNSKIPFKTFWNVTTYHWSNYVKSIKELTRVRTISCAVGEIVTNSNQKFVPYAGFHEVSKIRQIARENFKKEFSESINKEVEENYAKL